MPRLERRQRCPRERRPARKVFSQCEDLRSLSPAAFPGHPRFIPETTASAYAAATVYAAPRESQARLAAVEHITSGERNVAARHCIGGASAKRASRRTAAATLPVRPYAPHSPSPPGGRGRPGKKGVENAMGERARCTEGRSSHFLARLLASLLHKPWHWGCDEDEKEATDEINLICIFNPTKWRPDFRPPRDATNHKQYRHIITLRSCVLLKSAGVEEGGRGNFRRSAWSSSLSPSFAYRPVFTYTTPCLFIARPLRLSSPASFASFRF